MTEKFVENRQKLTDSVMKISLFSDIHRNRMNGRSHTVSKQMKGRLYTMNRKQQPVNEMN